MIQIVKNLLYRINKVQTYIIIAAAIALYFFIRSFLDGVVSNRIEKMSMENLQLRTLIEDNKKLIEEIHTEIEKKNEQIKRLEEKDKEFDNVYNKNNNEIQKLRKKYENINSVDKLNSADINNYFSNNYPE
jgi:predicted nuclease with TOPRIM domain